MVIAIPLIGSNIASRFLFADDFLIVDVNKNCMERLERVSCCERNWISKLNSLYMLGVDFVLCNRFNKLFLPLAGELGICIRTGYIGDARQTLMKYFHGHNLRNSNRACKEMSNISLPKEGKSSSDDTKSGYGTGNRNIERFVKKTNMNQRLQNLAATSRD